MLMKNLLGGKGLAAEMSLIGIPVPPGLRSQLIPVGI
jgi:phosphoenolpyruvate synthase/pyruvate phosphate dikinase